VMFLSAFSPPTTADNIIVGSQSCTCCCWWSLNMRITVAAHQIPCQFLVCFLYSVGFHFLFMLADLLLLCSEISVLCNLSSGSFLNSIQVDLNHMEKLSVLMKTYVLVKTSCIQLQRDLSWITWLCAWIFLMSMLKTRQSHQ
jgi:hypothetical protein